MEAASKRRGRTKPSASEADSNENGRLTRVVEPTAAPLLEYRRTNPEVRVWPFDCSIENHFRAMDLVAELCGEAAVGALDDGEIVRLCSSIAFSRAVDFIVEPCGEADFGTVDDGEIVSDAKEEWRYLNYEPGVIKFVKETQSLREHDASLEVTLPPFSSATIPQDNGPHTGRNSKDFVIYVGGSVSALDWCPRVCHRPEYQTKNEFIAVAAHPRGSYQHKLGAPLTGRGVIQIWSLLNVSGDQASLVEKPGQRHENSQPLKKKSSQPPKPRGRPRKKPSERPSDNLNCESQFGQPLAGDFPEKTPVSYTLDGVSGVLSAQVTGNDSGRKGRSREAAASPNTVRRLQNVGGVGSCHVDEHVSIMTENEERFLPCINQQGHSGFGECSAANNDVKSSRLGSHTLMSDDVAAPRLVLCLAHSGKVAWDVKWQPFDMHETKCIHLMGYLAVLLGNGSLEVWEVPLPQTVKVIYCSTQREDTDPRFVKLEPVFRCSTLKSGGIQSIPLSVEWSTSLPHEYLLVGCHDGTVALWKFFASDSSKDTRPLLHFTADTVPVRAVAWAPFGSDPESVNVIVTAGHGGIKFWDMRDPFHPLWHIHTAPKNILSLDWLPDPRCVLLSFDDGTVRLLSLSRSAYDGPVTGKPLCGTKQGLHTLYCSSFAIWSVHVSRHTGVVAYGGADGKVCLFQLTSKAVDKDSSRHRAPHFLCASIAEDGSAIVLNISPSDIPVTLGKPLKGTPSSKREMLSASPEAEGPNPDERTLALCYGDDPSVESGWEETLASFNSKKNQTSGKLNKKPRVEMQRDSVPETVPEGADEVNILKESETFPPKNVAMHRVRWNMNKGSERWLCSGGAAGILRCQEIDMLSTDRKSKWK